MRYGFRDGFGVTRQLVDGLVCIVRSLGSLYRIGFGAVGVNGHDIGAWG